MISEGRSFIRVSTAEGVYFLVEAYEESNIDVAVEKLLSQSGNPDTLLSLTMIDGDVLKIRASRICSWFVSTSESRKRFYENQKEIEDEEKRLKQEVGIWEEPG